MKRLNEFLAVVTMIRLAQAIVGSSLIVTENATVAKLENAAVSKIAGEILEASRLPVAPILGREKRRNVAAARP